VAVKQPWFDPNAVDNETNEHARRAFETVLFVRQRLYTGERYRRFAANVVEFARDFNRTKQLTRQSVRIEKTCCFFRTKNFDR
jgi:hypothetical protein